MGKRKKISLPLELNKPIINRGLSPIEIMIDNLDMRCCKCGAKAYTCDCWSKCPIKGCSWSIEKGHKCRNPNHA